MSYKNFKIHLKTINKHKIEVMKLCFTAGMIKQGLKHDLSKYSLTELKTGWKYADGKKSPIAYEKDTFGYSEGWLHHFHKNKHHYEYWYTPDLKKCGDMPLKYIYESALDRIAACKIYQGNNYETKSAYNYFMNSKVDPVIMGEWNATRLYYLFEFMCKFGERSLLMNIKYNFFEKFFEKEKDLLIKEFKKAYKELGGKNSVK